MESFTSLRSPNHWPPWLSRFLLLKTDNQGHIKTQNYSNLLIFLNVFVLKREKIQAQVPCQVGFEECVITGPVPCQDVMWNPQGCMVDGRWLVWNSHHSIQLKTLRMAINFVVANCNTSPYDFWSHILYDEVKPKMINRDLVLMVSPAN